MGASSGGYMAAVDVARATIVPEATLHWRGNRNEVNFLRQFPSKEFDAHHLDDPS